MLILYSVSDCTSFEETRVPQIRKFGVFGMSKGQSLQDPFLNTLRKEKIPVSIYLVNGIKLQGQVESIDQFAVLRKNSASQMAYKHAISTVVPSRPVKVNFPDDNSSGPGNSKPQVGANRSKCISLNVPAEANEPSWCMSISMRALPGKMSRSFRNSLSPRGRNPSHW